MQLSPLQDAWLSAIAEVRGTTRQEVVREAISWVAARESTRVSRTRHYRLIGYLAEQEAWNPVDDHLQREVEQSDAAQRPLPAVLRASLRPL